MSKVKLGDVADVYVSGVDKKTILDEQPVRLCNYTDVYYNWTIRKEMSEGFMSASARPNEIARFRLRAGQVVMTKDSETRSDIGHSAFVADDFEDVILGYHCALISPHEGKLSGQYLNGLLRTRHISDYLSRNAGGSGQRFYLSDSTIKAMPISLPPYDAQLRIAGVLGSIDEKIELNRRKIAELEALAKTIYDYWFVQFDFPDATGRPYKSSGGKMVWNGQLKREVPEGWEVAMLESIFTVCSGKDHKHLPDGKFPILGSGGIMRYGSEYLYDGESVLIPRKGTLNNVMFMQTPFWTVDTMFFTRAKRPHLMKYVYMTIRDFDFARLNTGTGVPSMTSSIINRIAITVPPKDLAERLDILLGDCFSRIELIKSEIEVLRTERNTLLPLLMNGQVKVAG